MLRIQPRWRKVEYRFGDSVIRDFVPTKPNAVTLVANDPFLPDWPKRANAKLDYNAIYLWNLRMYGARG